MELPQIGQVARLVSIELHFVLSLGETAEENNKRCIQKASDLIGTRILQKSYTRIQKGGRQVKETSYKVINCLLKTQHL